MPCFYQIVLKTEVKHEVNIDSNNNNMDLFLLPFNRLQGRIDLEICIVTLQ